MSSSVSGSAVLCSFLIALSARRREISGVVPPDSRLVQGHEEKRRHDPLKGCVCEWRWKVCVNSRIYILFMLGVSITEERFVSNVWGCGL